MEPKIKFKGGGSFVHLPPKFSADGQTLYVAWKNIIVSYNTRTGKRLKTFKGLHDAIADFNVHYFKNLEVVTACSVTGEVILWKADIGVRFLKMYLPVKNVTVESFKFFDEIDGKSLRFLLSWSELDKIHFGILSTEEKKLQRFNLILKKKHKCCVAFCNTIENPYMVVTQSNKLYFIRLLEFKKVYQYFVDQRKHFTCVACSPHDECILTGDSNGQILLWYNLTNKNPARSMFHWHTLAVKSVAFTMSGSEFYSGADECVLVKWHLDNSHQKNFLPRLPSGIEQLAVSNENQYIAVATGDNGIHVLDSSMNVISIIQHLVLSTTLSGGMVFDYRTKSLVLNGIIGHVQFYSPHDMSLLYNADVVGQNQLTNEQNYTIENTIVTKFAIDSRGSWLATVEERRDAKYSFELRLKFWQFNAVKQVFHLNTSIELPHKKSITEILFQPIDSEDLKCVTVGNDSKFKIWQLQNADTIYREAQVWNCTRVGFYRDLQCRALSFSSDASLIAVGFGPVLTTWLPDTCELKCSLVHSKNREALTSVQFGISNQCHLVVTTTQNHLSVWNLLTLCMTWTVPIQVSLLVPNPLAPHMAVFTKDRKLFIFYPDKSTPIFTESLSDAVLAGVFIPNSNSEAQTHWCRQSQLFFITTKQDLYCLDVDTDDTEIMDVFMDNFGSSLFSSLQPKIKSGNKQQSKPTVHLTEMSNKNQHLRKLLDSPVHTMVPIHLLCESLLRTYIKERKFAEPSND
ncbi:hypothetical protein RN001_014898 [Aquatica leii]|uniref:WD repeat-containing protein 75 second beta-propeller domain-containing protein n=1 Tax=Aquatica leii TaxID=1421715 RepID=A0AAN7PNZ1_9COLE|nr:hypothetical protein RN001_014898 [Aquatica leii]